MTTQKEKQSFKKRLVLAVVVTAIGLIIPVFIMDNRPLIFKWHDTYRLEEPIHLSHFSFLDREGKQRTFAEFSGKPSIVMFWATWCGICAQELPHVAAYHERVKEKIQFIPIAVPEDTPEKIEAFYQRFGGGNLPAYISDPQNNIHRRLGVIGIPKFFLLDEHGRAIARIRPQWNEVSELNRVIEMLLNGEDVSE